MRLVHIWQIRDAPFFTVLMGDSRVYDDWARKIAQGNWLGNEVFYQAPLYPYFLGVLYSIAGRDLFFVRVVQAIIGSLACVLLGLAGARLFSKRVGVIAGLGLALYAPAVFFDALLQKSVLDVFFVCLVICLLGVLIRPQRGQRVQPGKSQGVTEPQRLPWLWLGLAMGGLVLTRENAIVFTGVTLLWVLARRPLPGAAAALPGRKRLATAGVFLIGLTIVLLPVAVRNSVVGGGFYLTTAQFGPNFYIGNNARADGTYMPLRFGRGSPEYERQDATELAEEATGRQLSPADVSRYWTAQAWTFIRSEPVAWLKLLGRKSALLWNRTEMLDTESQDSHAEWSTVVRLAGRVGHFGVLVPLALLGVMVTWPLRDRLWVVYGISIAYAASVLMFYVFARYRYPLVPFLILFAAAGLAASPRLLRANARSFALAAAVAAAAVLVNWPMLVHGPDAGHHGAQPWRGASIRREAGRCNRALSSRRHDQVRLTRPRTTTWARRCGRRGRCPRPSRATSGRSRCGPTIPRRTTIWRTPFSISASPTKRSATSGGPLTQCPGQRMCTTTWALLSPLRVSSMRRSRSFVKPCASTPPRPARIGTWAMP